MNNKDYLDFLRKKNKEIMSKCYYCNGFSITIIADGYSIRPVCKTHDVRSLEEIEEDID
ncbi:MAG: hypothetical protein RL348_1782 [Bacteroidota bacterium]|jgi:hypothetical protein